MNQYEAGYQDTKPTRIEKAVALQHNAKGTPTCGNPDCRDCNVREMFTVEAEGTATLKEDGDVELDLAPVDDRHFFPVQTSRKVVYEVIWGPKDEQSQTYEDWDEAYTEAKESAKILGQPVEIEVTQDEKWVVG